MSLDAMKQALEYTRPGAIVPVTPETVKILVDALRLAIEQADRQEPVCDKDPRGCWNVRCQIGKVCKNAAPPQRQPLTEAQRQQRDGINSPNRGSLGGAHD